MKNKKLYLNALLDVLGWVAIAGVMFLLAYCLLMPDSV